MPADAAASSPSVIDPQQRVDELSSRLRESESRLALVTDAVAEGIYEWNIETNALWQSQRLAKIFGLEGRELKAADWNELVHFEDFERYRSALRDCFKGITGRLDCEYRVKHTDGSYRWLEDRAVPVRNAAGLAVRLVGAVTDVTGRKESEYALRETLEQQTATAEVLEVINSSPGDLRPVFEAMLERAMRLCGAVCGGLFTYDGQHFNTGVTRGVPPALAAYRAEQPPAPTTERIRRMLQTKHFVQVVDVMQTDGYRSGEPSDRAMVDLGGARTILNVPLLKDDAIVGMFSVYRQEPRAFSDKQIALLENFAAQAVIAMENARLISETREALEQQTATAEVLQVINTSPGDLAPVFDAMLEKAMTLCGAAFGFLTSYDGQRFTAVAMRGVPPSLAKYFAKGMDQPSPGEMHYRILHGEDVIHNLDQKDEEAYRSGLPLRRAVVDLGGGRTALVIALRKDGALLGILTIYRKEVRPFSEKQIALLKNFAAQAVIAMENARLFSELKESLERQTATAEILRVISQSPSDVQPVLDAVAKAAVRFCGAPDVLVSLRDGEFWTPVAHVGPMKDIGGESFGLNRQSVVGRTILDAKTIHVPDVSLLDPGEWTIARELAQRLGFGSAVSAPMLRDGEAIGVISLRRPETGEFTVGQIKLLEAFAAQAVIAIENVRLFTELRESLDQQTATSNVLKTISRSSVDLGAVLETLVETVARLCRADQAYMFRRDDELYHLVASRGLSDEAREFVETHPIAPGDPGTLNGRVSLDRRTVHIVDVLLDADYSYSGQKVAGFRTLLGIPLLRGEALIGIFNVGRTHVDPFTDKEIELAISFADQAVIAIENARLFEELRDRQAELRVTLDNMGDGVAMFDADHRLGAWNRNFEQIMGLSEERLVSRPGYAEYLEILAERGEFGTENVEAELASRLEDTERELRLERTRADGSVIEVRRNAVPDGGFVLIYSDVTERRRAEAEIRAARDAAEAALERQTATSDILKVIASSPTDVQPVLDAVAKAAVRFCGATDANIHMRDGDEAISAAHCGPLKSAVGRRFPLDRQTGFGTAILEHRTVQFPDIQALDPMQFASARRLASDFGFRAVLAAPFLREGAALGVMTLRRIEPGPFTEQQILLLETFAAQAVIAIENVRLFTELRDSLERLKAAQANLIQAEKMASLGQLTAGIAHEIKNPLNFVNNFAGLSGELLDELKEAAAPVLAGMNEDARAEFAETVELLTSNLHKIAEHGRRADGIVKSMLSHSRGGKGDWQESNINALVEEALNLAYHGARAQDQDFNVTLERDFASEPKSIEVVPQDVTRVFLNLFGNGFYATRKRHLGGADAGYRPTLRVSTRDLGEAVEVRVRDNGTGIQPEVRAKLFQPFFTTKPTGEGTGLGLSISYDIVTQQHGGSIDVESEPGSFTEFTVRLPRRRRAV